MVSVDGHVSFYTYAWKKGFGFRQGWLFMCQMFLEMLAMQVNFEHYSSKRRLVCMCSVVYAIALLWQFIDPYSYLILIIHVDLEVYLEIYFWGSTKCLFG